MLRALPLLLLLAGCPSSRPAPATTGSTSVSPSSDGARDTVESWRKAWELLSVEAVSALYAQGLDVVVVVQGRGYQGWTDVQTFLSTQVGAAKEARLRLDDVRTITLGDGAALVTASLSRDISDGVSYVTDRGMLTMVLRVQSDGSWRIVAEHYSYPPTVQ